MGIIPSLSETQFPDLQTGQANPCLIRVILRIIGLDLNKTLIRSESAGPQGKRSGRAGPGGPHSWLSWPLSCPLAQSLTTCEVCGACFETRKGLSSHARSHLRQLGVAESESSGAPIDLLYELVKQKGLPDTPLGLPPGLTKKSSSPKEVVAGAPRQSLLTLAKPLDAPAINKAIKSPPGFSAKGLAHPPSSPLLKKAPLALAGSPIPKNPEDKSPQLSLSPRPVSPKAQWPQSEDEGPLNLSECGSWELREVPALGGRRPQFGL